MKRIFSTILIIALALVACQSSQSQNAGQNTNQNTSQSTSQSQSQTQQVTEPERKLRIAWINPLMGFPLYNKQDNGALAGAADYGVELTILGTPIISPEQYTQQIENALADRYDGIALNAYVPEAMIPVLEKIRDAGIPVVFTFGFVPDRTDLNVSLLGVIPEEYAAYQAKVIAEKMNGEANLVRIQTTLDGINGDIGKLFEKKLEEYPGMNLVVTESNNADMLIAVQKLQDIFLAHPEINAAVMDDVIAGPAAAQVAREMNRDITILAVDDEEETLDKIRSGEIWGTLASNYYGMGYESVRLLVEVLNGEDIPPYMPLQMVVVTQENLDTFEDELVALTKVKGIPW